MKASAISTLLRSRAAISGVDLGSPQRDRLFAEHVLAGIGGLDGPFHMLAGRQRNVDGVDRVGGQHLLIGAEGMRYGEAVGHGPGAGDLAAGNGGDDAVFRILDGRYHRVLADTRGGQNSETQHEILPRVC